MFLSVLLAKYLIIKLRSGVVVNETQHPTVPFKITIFELILI